MLLIFFISDSTFVDFRVFYFFITISLTSIEPALTIISPLFNEVS